jgi:hypothetical protein
MKIKKLLAFGIILLFIGVAIAPGINFTIIKASNGNDLVEVTTQACGIQGYGNTTVIKLTKEQYEDLEQYLVEFRARLNQTTTREEAIPIFKDAVVELDKYGLLPKVMSVEETQGLVTRNYPESPPINVHDIIYGRNQIFNNSNLFCLITGETTRNTRLFSVVEMGCSLLCWFLFVLSFFVRCSGDNSAFLNDTISLLKSIRNFSSKLNAARLIGTGIITFGDSHPASIPPPYRYDPAQGWITTLGVLGKKSWNGTFFGRILQIYPFDSDDYTFYTGAIGFSGIKLDRGNGKLTFLGSAIFVNIK